MTLYELLGVAETASEKEIKAALLALSNKYKDAAERGDKDALIKIKWGKEAFDTLINAERRNRYDERLAAKRQSAGPDQREPPTAQAMKAGSLQPATSATLNPPTKSGLGAASVVEPRPADSALARQGPTQNLVTCPDCGNEVSRRAETCPKCGAPLQAKNATAARSLNVKQWLGVAGSLTLFFGVFAPIVSLPIVGNMNYFQNGKGDGIIVLILAVISLALVFMKQYKKLLYSGLASLGVMLFTFARFHYLMSELKSDMASDLAGNPFRGLANAALQAVQLQWGWAVLVVGALLIIASALIKEEPQ